MKNIIFLLFFIVVFSCNKSDAVAEKSMSAMTVIEDENAAAPLDKTDAAIVFKDKEVEISEQNSTSQKGNIISKKIIKNGEMEIQVGEMKNAISKSMKL